MCETNECPTVGALLLERDTAVGALVTVQRKLVTVQSELVTVQRKLADGEKKLFESYKASSELDVKLSALQEKLRIHHKTAEVAAAVCVIATCAFAILLPFLGA